MLNTMPCKHAQEFLYLNENPLPTLKKRQREYAMKMNGLMLTTRTEEKDYLP